MQIFDNMAQRIHALSKQSDGEPSRPLAVFDIDDTLIDCRYRKSLVFRDFALDTHVATQWPQESQKLREFPWEKLCYRVHDNLKLMAIEDETFGKELFSFWLKHYFTYPYLIQDKPFPGAIDFVTRCRELGAHIVYLTARDHLGMYQGTIETLTKLGFPMHWPDIHVMLKPDSSLSDHHFKVAALEPIASLGDVVASFENELINLNAMAERFPKAAMYWRKTLYAPDPPAPHSRVEIMLHFPSIIS